MKQIVLKSKNKIIEFAVMLAFSIFAYSELMVNQLVNNYDGIWEGNYHIAGPWELSIGRWFWYYLSKLRFGIASDPVVSIISLVIFVLGIMFLLDLMEVKESVVAYAAAAMFICAPLVCIDLSYRYMSPTFATAFFLAIMSVWLAVRIDKLWLAIPAGSISLALSLGSYQAYIGVTCVVVLAWFIKKLMGNENLGQCLRAMIAPIASVLGGGVLYIIGLNIHLKKDNVVMSDYMGASSYSIGTFFKSFPGAFRGIYQIFYLSMKGILFKFNRLSKFHICLLLIILFSAWILCHFVKMFKTEKAKIPFVILAILLLPAAAYSVKFITVDAPISLQMTGGFFMTAPALLCALPISFESVKKEKTKNTKKFSGSRFDNVPVEKILGIALITGTVIFTYGEFYQIQADQNAMLQGKQSVISITDAILDKTIDLDYLNPDYEYCFVGAPVGSRLYYVDDATFNANAYARFGAWWDGYNSEKSWAGVIHDYKNLNLNIVGEVEYNGIIGRNEVIEMPAFPREGSIALLDDKIVVIKVNE